LILVVDDWRLMDNGEIQPSFGNFHDAMMAGRLGQYITLNSEDTLDVPVLRPMSGCGCVSSIRPIHASFSAASPSMSCV
jgi:hypothetical protein